MKPCVAQRTASSTTAIPRRPFRGPKGSGKEQRRRAITRFPRAEQPHVRERRRAGAEGLGQVIYAVVIYVDQVAAE